MTTPPHGSVLWSELVTKDVDTSKAYFAEVAGWTYQEAPMPTGVYHIAMVGESMVAGIMSLDELDDPSIAPHWMTYLAVTDVDAATAQTEANAGTVI